MNEKLVREALALLDERVSTRDEMVKELLQEAIAPKPHFYKNQPVLVSNDGEDWVKRYFNKIEEVHDGSKFSFSTPIAGATSYSGTDARQTYWKYCKPDPDPDAESIINWIKYDGGGDMPVIDDVTVAVLGSDGANLEFGASEDFEWSGVGYYAVIPLPEFL